MPPSHRPYATQQSPQYSQAPSMHPQPTQYAAPLPPAPPNYGYVPPVRAGGVPGWVWVLLAVVVVGFFGLTAVVAGAMVIAKSNAPTSPSRVAKSEEPAPAPTSTSARPRGRSTLPPVERHVPFHDVSILKGCSSGDIATIERRLDAAIKVGAPAYNAGDFGGCYSTYDSAAAKLELALSNTCTGPVNALESGRTTAREKDNPSDRAWAMRDSFDGLFDVIDRSAK